MRRLGLTQSLFNALTAKAAPRPAARVIERRLEIGEESHNVTIRLDSRARRISVRVDPSRGQILITAPPRAGIQNALTFAGTQARWIKQRLARVPAAVPFVPGSVVPVEGVDLVLTHCPDQRGTVWVDGDRLCVAGSADHMARRVNDWLKARARTVLAGRCAYFAARLGLEAPKIQVRDTLTRWGSCSAGGVLSFSWRLILAPPSVLDYVAAHEVCHLRHMNHSKRFWALCGTLIEDIETPQAWLSAFGVRLHRIGRAE